jgi:hypothetical protein
VTGIVINLTRQAKHWSIQLAVDGQIEATTIFGCREALTPLVTGLMAAEAENTTVGPRSETDRSIGPATITVGMPSGRVLTFSLTSLQEALPNVPEGLSG